MGRKPTGLGGSAQRRLGHGQLAGVILGLGDEEEKTFQDVGERFGEFL